MSSQTLEHLRVPQDEMKNVASMTRLQKRSKMKLTKKCRYCDCTLKERDPNYKTDHQCQAVTIVQINLSSCQYLSLFV